MSIFVTIEAQTKSKTTTSANTEQSIEPSTEDIRTANQIFVEHAGYKYANIKLHAQVSSLTSMVREKDLVLSATTAKLDFNQKMITKQDAYMDHLEDFFNDELKRIRKSKFWAWVIAGVSVFTAGYFAAN